MSIVGRQSLLRAAAELLNRLSRTELYLNEILYKDSNEFKQLWDSISGALKQIKNQTIRSLEVYLDVGCDPDLRLVSAAFSTLRQSLKRRVNDFVEVHELLVYLPRVSVDPETYDLLEGSIGQLYSDEKPSIILSSVLNAFEYDFLQVMKSKLPGIEKINPPGARNIVLELALCDKSCPVAWSILAHELGHSVDKKRGISRKVVKDVWDKIPEWLQNRAEFWCQELFADIFAARTLGPAPILALLSLEYAFLPSLPAVAFDDKTHMKHPPTIWRLRAVTDFLFNYYHGLNLLSHETTLYKDAWKFDLLSRFPDKGIQLNKREKEEDQYNRIIAVLSHQISSEIKNLNLPEHSLNFESLDRCQNRLLCNQPIGSQGANRKSLQTDIWHYRALYSESSDSDLKAEMFTNLLSKFDETPLPLPSILVSGFYARYKIFEDFIDNIDTRNVSSELDTMNMNLDNIDVKIGDSIRTSRIHSLVLSRIKEAKIGKD